MWDAYKDWCLKQIREEEMAKNLSVSNYGTCKRCGKTLFTSGIHTCTPKEDVVNYPKHYINGSIEVIDFIENQNLDFRLANVIKYICRANLKGFPKQDVEKAMWYLNRYYEKVVKA